MATETTALDHSENKGGDWGGGTSPMKASYGKLMMWYFLLSDAFTFAGFLITYGTLRVSVPSWPVPDFVYKTMPFIKGDFPLIFVTIMTFILIVSSVTMVRAVQEGHRENKKGVIFWMALTIIGGATFLGSQAFEWTTLIVHENMSLTTNPFGTHMVAGTYTQDEHGHAYEAGADRETFEIGDPYLVHAQMDDHHNVVYKLNEKTDEQEKQWIKRTFVTSTGEHGQQEFGPKAFGALFFFITGFHGFHVFSGVVFLLIILMNVITGLYVARKNGYEMVEKIGLYWHFVDLVWVFVFLVFYLL